MADKVLFQSDDQLTEQNISRTRGRSNMTDYVERGLGVVVDDANNTIDVNSGYAVISDGIDAYDVFPGARADKALATTSGMNYVYLSIDPTVDDDIQVDVKDSQTPPANRAALLIATVDASVDPSEVVPKNPNPDGEFDSLSADQATINQVAGVLTNGTNNQSISSGAVTKQEWSNVVREDSDVVSADTTNDEINVLVAGDYVVNTSIRWDSDSNWSTGDRAHVEIFVNGSSTRTERNQKAGTDFETAECTAFLNDLAVNDTIDIRVLQNSGSSILSNADPKSTRFEVFRVA